MYYSNLVDIYERLERVTSKLEKTHILAKFFKETPSDELEKVVLLVQGKVFPKFTGYELGIAAQMMIKAISKFTGFSTDRINDWFREKGDLGLVAEECVAKKKQVVLFSEKLTIDKVFDNLQKLAFLAGTGSQDKKLNIIGDLLASAEPKEARYIVRTVLGELRVGVAEGIIRDSIVEAFLLREDMSKAEKRDLTDLVNYAWSILSDYGEVARIAKEKGVEGLKKVRLQPGRPYQVMLGLAAKSIDDVVKEFGKIAAEWKYDGMRTIIEKKGDSIWLFSRRLENITNQFPDIVEFAREALPVDECIVEGETLGIDTKTGYPLPFQALSQRIQRKYNIEKMVKEIPIQVNVFDIVYLNGEMLLDKPFIERRKILEQTIKVIPGKFQLSKQIITDDLKKLEEFYQEALRARQEGLMLKVLDAPYTFGRHVGTMYKIKPIMETLDLVIVGAEWGTGSRANWLSSYVIACRDPNTGKYLPVGMMGTGLSEEQFKKMTETLKPLIISQKGKYVEVRPEVVVEVGYQEIQKSPNYESGMALRFPRLIRIRTDKSADECDTIQRVESLYKSQGKIG
ncbi:MAG: ATP-dependent DNA ligase [Candidatus Asgardarchaeia archaeon]